MSVTEAPQVEPESIQRWIVIASPSASGGETHGLARKPIWICQPGQTLGHIVDVKPPTSPQTMVVLLEHFRLGRNTAWDEAHLSVVAGAAGHVVLREGTLSVEEHLDLSDDLDASAGMVDFPGNVLLHRNILDLAVLQAQGDIAVQGSIEAATVSASGSVSVSRGICGKERGRVTADKSIKARFTSNARITAGQDVVIENEVANSHVTCGGHFGTMTVSVLSSHVIAGRGICCDAIGSNAGFRTILELNISPEELALARKNLGQLSALQKKADDIRSAVLPLMQNQKNLTAAQKEKATELLYLADEAQANADQISKTLEPQRQRMHDALSAEIRVQSHLHEGAILRCLGYETTVAAPLRGPLRIILRVAADSAVFVVTDAHAHTIALLPATMTEHGQWIRQFQKVST